MIEKDSRTAFSGEGIGYRFQSETKFNTRKLRQPEILPDMPEHYKSYPQAEYIRLPDFRTIGEMKVSLKDLFLKRRSVRDYANNPLTLEELSFLLWASTGISLKKTGYAFRTAPSAGALYPIETYLCIKNIRNTSASAMAPEKGIYHYNIEKHGLELLKKGDFAEKLACACLGQDMFLMSAVDFIWTGIFARTVARYGQRGFRYVYLDAAHIAANLSLACTALGIGTCQIGAFIDDEVNNIIDVDGSKESVIYMSTVGRPL
ncbi:MAG: SagB/ThcOx family dehydrogenase [Thermoplasmata archaeon]